MKYAFAVLALLLAGCAASAQTQTRTASVDVNALLPKHPLYGTLAQYDRQIAALETTLHTQFVNSGPQIDNAGTAVRHDLDDAANAASRYHNVIVTYRSGVMVRYRSGVMVSPSNHAEPVEAPSPGQIESGIESAYQQQHAELQGTAQRDMAQYRANLLAQQQSAYKAFVQSVNNRMQRAYEARAQELREKETTLLLDYSRKFGSRRLILRAKLQTLVMRSPRRKGLQAQLAQMQNEEFAGLKKMRAGDARILSAYSAQLRARADGDIAKMRADLQARTNANLAARERVLAAQTSSAGTLQLPASHARSGSIADMQTQYSSLVNTQSNDASAFTRARADLTNRFRELHKTNANNTASVRSQLGWLRHDRDAVRKRMIAQIMDEAQRIANARGISQVSDVYHAARGSIDLTSAVAADLRALSP